MADKHSRDVDNEDEGNAIEVALDEGDGDSSVTITIPTE